MKILSPYAAVVLFAISGAASGLARPPATLVIRHTQGVHTAPMSEVSEVRFDANTVKALLTNGSEINVDKADFLSLRLDGQTNSATDIAGDAAAADITFDGETVSSSCGAAITVYNAAGTAVAHSGHGTVSLRHLPQGVYLVSSGNHTIKIAKP